MKVAFSEDEMAPATATWVDQGCSVAMGVRAVTKFRRSILTGRPRRLGQMGSCVVGYTSLTSEQNAFNVILS